MTFARILLGEGFPNRFLLQITRLGSQCKAVHVFKNLFDWKDRRQTQGTTAKHLNLGLITSGQPNTSE